MTRRTEKTGRNRPPAAGAVGSFSAGTACGYGDAQARPIRKMKKTVSGFRAAKKKFLPYYDYLPLLQLAQFYFYFSPCLVLYFRLDLDE